LKGKKRVRLDVVESDWKSYMGSSQELLDDIKSDGLMNFEKSIICLCDSKAMLNYMELHYQMEHNVLLRDDYYNNIINIRLHSSTLRKNKKEISHLTVR
jgi:hypothetical protein